MVGHDGGRTNVPFRDTVYRGGLSVMKCLILGRVREFGAGVYENANLEASVLARFRATRYRFALGEAGSVPRLIESNLVSRTPNPQVRSLRIRAWGTFTVVNLLNHVHSTQPGAGMFAYGADRVHNSFPHPGYGQ